VVLLYVGFFLPRKSLLAFAVFNLALLFYFGRSAYVLWFFLEDRIQAHSAIPPELYGAFGQQIKPGHVVLIKTTPPTLDLNRVDWSNPPSGPCLAAMALDIYNFVLAYFYFFFMVFYLRNLLRLKIWRDFAQAFEK
jgi:hypothetical protein